MEGRQHAQIFPAPGKLPPPASLSLALVARNQSHAAWLSRMAAYREGHSRCCRSNNLKLFEVICRIGAGGDRRHWPEARAAALAGGKPARSQRLANRHARIPLACATCRLTTRNHARVGTRERVLEVAEKYPDRLKIELNALVTRVLLDENRRAIGVEYLQWQAALSRARRSPAMTRASGMKLRASREVILAGGAFNTPQLLMLSGIGPRARAGAARHRSESRSARRGQEPAGPLRGRRRQPHELRRVGCFPRREV